MLPIETNVRPTDVAADKPYSRLGNTGDALLDDLLDRIHQALGRPLEVDADNPVSPRVTFQAGIYTLPNGRRVTSYRNGNLPAITNGIIDFDNGTISAGTNPTFTPPSMTLGNWIRALVQYSFGKNAIQVTFGTQNANVNLCSVPSAIIDYEPIAICELYALANGSGPGTFDNIQKTGIITILDSLDFDSEPQEEVQTVAVASQTVFTLSSITIPSHRMRLDVFVNGIKQIQGTHYIVNSDIEVGFIDPIPQNAEVTFRVE